MNTIYILHVCMYARMYISMHVCMYVCMYVCIYIYAYVCMLLVPIIDKYIRQSMNIFAHKFMTRPQQF